MSTYRSTTSQQSSSVRQTSSAIQSSTSGVRGTDLQVEQEVFLKYSSIPDQVVISGNSDYGILASLKSAITQLKSDFYSRTGSITIKNEERAELDQRFILFEHELEGLLRRRI